MVLIRCATPPQAYISPLLLSERHPVEYEKWKSMGFPKIGKEDDGKRHKISAMGEIFPPDKCSAILDLESQGDAKDKAGWQGISGAPVFRGHTLIAVMVDTPNDINERLRAVSIAYLLEKEEKFRELTGIASRNCDFNSAIETLQNNPTVKSALFKQICQNDTTVTDSVVQIINYLSRIPIPELISTIYSTQQNNKDKTLRSVLARLLRELLPSLYDSACAAKIRSAKDNHFSGILQIPYATDVSAEMLMASADNRPADFRLIPIDLSNPDRKQVMPGSYKLALPPESGTTAVQQEDISDDLFSRLLGVDCTDNIAIAIDEYLFRKIPRKQAGRHYTAADKKKLIKSALELDAKNQKPGYYWIWNISDEIDNENYKNSFKQLAQDIKNNYPAITLLSLDVNIDRELEENELFDLLPDTQSD